MGITQLGKGTKKIDLKPRKRGKVRLDRVEKRVGSVNNYIGKEFFDKFGSGLVNQQFINVLFSQMGASYFIIGIFHGLRDLLSIFTSIFMREYLRVRNPMKWRITLASVLMGLSYIFVAVGLFGKMVWLVGISLVLAGVFTTYLGQIYAKYYVIDSLRYSKLRDLPQYGVAIIGVSLLLGGWLLDRFPTTGRLIRLGADFALPGYFILVAVAVLCFLISMFFLRRVVKKERFEIKASLWFVVKEHLQKVWKHAPVLYRNRIVLIALIAGTMTGIVQTLGNVYYGLFIYKTFTYVGFGGFMNIAMIFIISMLSLLMSSTIARILSKKYGNIPILVFGTLMVGLQPLIYYYKPNLLSISMATMMGVIGASLVGLAVGLLVTHALSKTSRERYYTVFSFMVTLPYLVFVPLGAWVAQVYGLQILFLVMGITLVAIVTPMYFIVQLLLGKKVA